jgi:hypothetical protein
MLAPLDQGSNGSLCFVLPLKKTELINYYQLLCQNMHFLKIYKKLKLGGIIYLFNVHNPLILESLNGT